MINSLGIKKLPRDTKVVVDMSGGVDHHHDHETKDEPYPEMRDRPARDGVDHDRATASEHQGKGADHFSAYLGQ